RHYLSLLTLMSYYLFFFLTIPRPPRPTLFPYTTLFRSAGGDDKRGWSLRGHVVYPLRAEDGQLLGWIARDPSFEEKERAFLAIRSEEHTSELQSRSDLVCRLLLEKKKKQHPVTTDALYS